MRLIRWQRVRSSVDGLPFVPVVATQAGRRKLAGAKEPSQRIRRNENKQWAKLIVSFI
ncbi:hypothetical protein [Brevibacillus sp. NRS-1366]|uniref:hypothetical protein n=1 Tax=Brevibacillus sp. NRS-1366 TaxID=3233899 RepID=UPI003D1A0B60